MVKIRSPYSQAPFQICMHDASGLISTGTAFLYTHEDKSFIITNWHNISGRNFLTKDPLSNRFPTYIEIMVSKIVREDGAFAILPQRIDIYKDYEPAWYEHPLLGSDCDVIAIPYTKPSDMPFNMHTPVNKIGKIKIPVLPGNSCFIIGFPISLSVGFGLPIWKSGYIASEPTYDVTIGGKFSALGGSTGGVHLPAFFIDSLTRQGMSGAPVFARYTGNWDVSDPYRQIDPASPDFLSRDDIAIGESRMEFVGCYSARIGKEEEGAALGICWREDVIIEICASKKQGEHPQVGT